MKVNPYHRSNCKRSGLGRPYRCGTIQTGRVGLVVVRNDLTTVTLKNTKVLYVNPEENIIVVKGSVPGKKNTVLKIQSQKKV